MSELHLDRLHNTNPRRPDFDCLTRHRLAISNPESLYERGLVQMMTGWLTYADAVKEAQRGGVHNTSFDQDWPRIGTGLRWLLNGPHGRLNCEAIDLLICECLGREGFNPADC